MISMPVQNRFHVMWQAREVFPVAAYCGPEAGQPKGQNGAVSEAMDGAANVAEGMPGSPATAGLAGNPALKNWRGQE